MESDRSLAQKASKPSLAIMLAVALLAIAGDLVVWGYAGIVCGVSENSDLVTPLCVENDPRALTHLPLVGAIILAVSVPLAHRSGRESIFALGLVVALLTGATTLLLV